MYVAHCLAVRFEEEEQEEPERGKGGRGNARGACARESGKDLIWREQGNDGEGVEVMEESGREQWMKGEGVWWKGRRRVGWKGKGKGRGKDGSTENSRSLGRTFGWFVAADADSSC